MSFGLNWALLPLVHTSYHTVVSHGHFFVDCSKINSFNVGPVQSFCLFPVRNYEYRVQKCVVLQCIPCQLVVMDLLTQKSPWYSLKCERRNRLLVVRWRNQSGTHLWAKTIATARAPVTITVLIKSDGSLLFCCSDIIWKACCSSFFQLIDGVCYVCSLKPGGEPA